MTPVEVLRSIGADILGPDSGIDSVNFRCLQCGKPKAYMFTDKWPYHVRCFGGGEHLSTTLAGLYADARRLGIEEARKQVAAHLHMSSAPVHVPRRNVSVSCETAEIPAQWVPIQKTDRCPHVSWLKKRGFNWEWVERMNVRWDASIYGDFVMFPIVESGIAVSYEKRCIVKEVDWQRDWHYRKTMCPKDVRNSHFIYGYDLIRSGERIVLVEGIPNWFSLVQAGFNAGAIFGSSPSERQIHLLIALEPTEIILAFDGDKAGLRGVSKMRAALSRLSDISVEPWILPGGQDINDVHDPAALKTSFVNRRQQTLQAVLEVSDTRLVRRKR